MQKNIKVYLFYLMDNKFSIKDKYLTIKIIHYYKIKIIRVNLNLEYKFLHTCNNKYTIALHRP